MTDASLVRSIREEHGISMREAARAIEIANERFDGDFALGIRWVHANAFAINVKGDRAAWNDAWARGGAQ